MTREDYVSLEVAKLLKEKGFDWYVSSMFCNVYRIKDEIIEKYPGLSDDGYYDLLKDNGGNLSEEEVYGYYIDHVHISCRNTEEYFNHYSYMICARPMLYEAQKWLREKSLVVEVGYMYGDYYIYDILKIPTHDLIVLNDRKPIKYGSYEEALNDGIKEALKLI